CLRTGLRCVINAPLALPGTGNPKGPGLALVLCTGAALRRLSAWLSMLHKEGCFSPASGQGVPRNSAAWNNPASRGSAEFRGTPWPAGPRAFRVPGRVVDEPFGATRGCPAVGRAALFLLFLLGAGNREQPTPPRRPAASLGSPRPRARRLDR